MTGPFRLLVTGARTCTPVQARYVRAILGRVWFYLATEDRDLIVIEGECPTGGVDLVARQWAESMPDAVVEPYPAETRNGQFLGPARNARMVASGAHLCVGFPDRRSRGTWDCLRKAADAGINCRIFPLPVHDPNPPLADALDAIGRAGGVL